jgi:hypothetical protein
MIRRLALALVSFAFFLPALFAQDAPPVALFEATQCLATGKYAWIELTGQKTVQLAYSTDKFEGSRYLYVLVFTAPKRDQGKVFDIRMSKDHSYTIENNGRFVVTDKGFTFTEPPLGGNWTVNQLGSRVQQILRHRKWYEAEVKRVLKPNDHLQCETAVEDIIHPAPKPKPQFAEPTPEPQQAAPQPPAPPQPADPAK